MRFKFNRTLRIITVVLLVWFSISLLMSARALLSTFICLVVLWGLGYLIYRNFAGIKAWFHSDIPLKDFLAEQREAKESQQKNERPTPITRDMIPGAHESVDLTEHEQKEWDTFKNMFGDK
jgi:hypothetical protein